ncbi:biotin transporter BioY [Aminipila terrae]|uniref:Biotin transporter n=1 Tax=Aminipila terrae TaxID=2697030 RepID=A0A6P1MG18_9FIRM|nr:biotin transporter BioY [Aminipila terrae]
MISENTTITSKKRFTTRELVLCALFTGLTAIGAFIQIPVPFMDYFTLQFLFVTLSGMLLGSRLGMIATGSYVLMGLMGIPVFAAGGGIQYIFRPSFGYLIGFVATSFAVGFLCERITKPQFKYYLPVAFTGMLITYTIGFIYKYFMLNFYMHEPTAIWAVIAASLPLDIPGDALLCILASLLASRLFNPLKRLGV